MNCIISSDKQAAESIELVDLVDFKWLMAHEGHHVHVARLQTDSAYARECLAHAAASPTDTLRAVAQRLCGRMGLALA
jgi:hypothetical protein